MPMRWLRGERSTTIRTRIRWLVVACIVPAWLLAVAISYFSYFSYERESIVNATVQTARSLTQGVERELAMSVAVLQTLATSTRIDERDFARFHERAAQAMKLSAADNIVLFDTELQVLMSAAHPISTALSKVKHDRLPSVIATGQPAVSDYFDGELSKQPRIVVAVPVLRDDKVVGRLDMVFSTKRFAQVLERQDFPPGWTVVVLDSQGVIVARNRDPDQAVGKQAAPTLLAQLKARGEGSYTGALWTAST